MEKSTMSVQDLARQMGISLPKACVLVKEPEVVIYNEFSRIGNT